MCAMPIYWLSIFRMPNKVKKRIEQLCRKFLWFGGSTVRKKISLAAWKLVCTGKEQGGLGITNLATRNKALLGKWLWRYYNPDETGLWKIIILSRYKNRVNSQYFSPFWKEIYKLKTIFDLGINKIVENGKNTFFLER